MVRKARISRTRIRRRGEEERNLEGCRVKLKPFEDNPEEYGVCCSPRPDNGTVIVRLDPAYVAEANDDGLREVPLDQVEFLN